MSEAKSLAVAQSILKLCGEVGDAAVTPMQLIKMTYIAHGYMLGLHGKPLLTEPVQAWQYGPVVPSVYHAVKEFRSSPVGRIKGAQEDFSFDDDEREVLGLVCKRYGRFDGVTLSAATHRPGTPWALTWAEFGKNSPISNDLIESFYSKLLKQPSHSSL